MARQIPMVLVLALLLASGCAPALRIDQSPVPPIQRTGAAFNSAGCFSAEPTPEECAEPPCASVPPPPDFFQKLSKDVVEQAIRSFQQRRNLEGPAADAAWPPFLETLDAYLAQAPEHLSLSPLIRARVAAEFELDQEQRKEGGADPALKKVVLAFIARLDRQVRAQHALASTADQTRPKEAGALSWPLSRGVITSGYGYRRDPLNRTLQFHGGLDLAAETNDPVYAAAPGRVVFAGWGGNAGNTIRIRHDAHSVTLYAHLATIMVEEDQEVRAGDVIGQVGSTGRATGPHLHFAFYSNDEPVDPVDYLRSVPMAFSDLKPGVIFGTGEEP